MQKTKWAIGLLAIFCGVFAIYFVLSQETALVVHPKGLIAHSELRLIGTNLFLMLLIVVPTLILFFAVAWKYRAKNPKAKYDPEANHRFFRGPILWILPLVVIIPMAIITWFATHKLDPYRPLEGEVKPLTIQVVALDWKWLFIYPEQGIAALNLVQIPEKTPIRFELSADGSPMNSFWIPQLSGQIYSMTGMTTTLHLIADGVGEYRGRAAEINGDGYADMIFVVRSTSESAFNEWVSLAKESPNQLNDATYNDLVKPSMNLPITLYSFVEKDLYHRIMMKYMHM